MAEGKHKLAITVIKRNGKKVDFDGEKIAQIIDDNQISGYLKEIINVNFNLNIFEKMEDDINFYIQKEKSRKKY